MATIQGTSWQGWSRRLDGYRTAGLGLYVYFNNDWECYAIYNARRLRELMGV